MVKTTAYFRNEVMRKRPYLTFKMCIKVLKNPYRKEVQPDEKGSVVRFRAVFGMALVIVTQKGNYRSNRD